MIYSIQYSGEYTTSLNNQLNRLVRSGVSTFTIDKWFGKLSAFAESLSEWPERFPIDQVVTKATGQETRKANFGDYLILYCIDHEQYVVTLLAFVHGSARRER